MFCEQLARRETRCDLVCYENPHWKLLKAFIFQREILNARENLESSFQIHKMRGNFKRGKLSHCAIFFFRVSIVFNCLSYFSFKTVPLFPSTLTFIRNKRTWVYIRKSFPVLKSSWKYRFCFQKSHIFCEKLAQRETRWGIISWRMTKISRRTMILHFIC